MSQASGLSVCRIQSAVRSTVRKAAVNGVSTRSSVFIEILRLTTMFGVLDVRHRERILALEFESAHPSVIKSIKQRDLLNTWLRLYARERRCRPSMNTSLRGSPMNFPISSITPSIPRNNLRA
jgi:hypothetical protein